MSAGSGLAVELKARGILPHEHGDRVLGLRALRAHVGRLGARRLELRLRLIDIGHGRRAALIQALRQLQGLRIVPDRRVEQLLLRVLAAQGEVVGRQLGVQREIEARQIGGARLLARLGRIHGVAYPAPDVDLVREIRLQIEIVERRFVSGNIGRRILRDALREPRRSHRQGRETDPPARCGSRRAPAAGARTQP